MSTWRPISPTARWQRWLPARLHRPARWIIRITLAALLAVTTLVVTYALKAQRYDLDRVAQPPVGTRFFDRDGAPLAAAGASGRQLAQRSDIPAFLVDALRAREDARFFDHSGIDVRGLARALLRNLKDRKFTQGASTLSMQLVRNTFGLKEKSLDRKLLEIALTLRLEARYSKDEILTHYLNTIYFGAGADGISQAARVYFGKSPRELSEGECALIVGIIRGPHIFSPSRNLPAALAQREQTLDRLVAMGLIDPARRHTIANEPVRLVPEENRTSASSYALQAVRRELDWILGEIDALSSGLQVTTTLDAAWQARLEHEVSQAISQLESDPSWTHPRAAAHPPGTDPRYLQFAAVTTETKTGATLAVIGGRDFQDSRFDRTRAHRDLGSIIEPFVAAAAAEGDHPVLPGRPVQTGRAAGPSRVVAVARRCGLTGRFNESEDLFRGAAAASPASLSVALATLGNQGRRPTPFLVRQIRDSSGRIVYSATPRLVPAVSTPTAAAGLRILPATGSTRTLTGATGSERDAWILRLGPSGATALWIGFDQPAPIAPEPRLDSLLDTITARLENR